MGRLCVCVMCVLQAQGGVRMLYIVITVLFLPMTAIAEVMVGGGGCWCGGRGGREARRCSAPRVRPDS